MALVERLCQVEEDYTRNIAYEPFVAGLVSVLSGAHTIAQVKAFYQMDAADEAEFDTLVDRITDTPQTADRTLKILRVKAIMSFWEMGGITTYDSVAGIRTHLNAI